MKNTFIYLGIALLSVVLTSATLPMPTEDIAKWERLGSRKVDFKLDKDIIQVGAKDGLFSKLKLVVSGGELHMHHMKVNYRNGQSEDINLRHRFEKKSTTRVIDLNGNKRIIKSIVFFYDTDNRAKRKAKVTLFGK